MDDMAAPKTRTRSRSAETRVPRTYRLPLSKIRAAKRVLGTTNSTETIEHALDMIVFRQELIEGTRAMFGIHITSPDPEE
jgi:hypothetical protein